MSRQQNNQKKRLKRVVIGSVLKGNGEDLSKPTMYIKIKKDVSFNEGQTISVETKKYRLASLENAVANGKLSEEKADEIRASIEKTPDFVVGDLVQLVEA